MELLERHFDIALETPDGIKKLRELILSLAMKGKLVSQNPKDQSARELLKEIEAVKAKMVLEGTIKKQETLSPIKQEELPYELPNGWEWIKLGECCVIIMGQSPDSSSYNEVGDGIPFYQGKTDYGDLYPTPRKWCSKPEKIAKENDILISVRAPVGPTNVCQTESCIGRGLSAIRMLCNSEVFYFLYFFRTFEKYIASFGTGSTFSAITSRVLQNLLVPLAPLAEQKLIVEKIDQLMALCDKLEAERNERDKSKIKIHSTAMNRLISAPDSAAFNSSWSFIAKHFSELYSVRQNVVELKKAILQLAVMGKLVPRDANDQPASELFKEIEVEKLRLVKDGKIKKQEIMQPVEHDEVPYQLPEGWMWCRFFNINIVRSELVKPEDYLEEKQIAPDSIEKGSGVLLFDRSVRESGVTGPNNRFYKGQILYSKIRPSLSKAVIAPYDGLCSADMYPVETFVDTQFMLKVILSESFLEQVRIAENRIKMPKLNLDSLGKFVIPLPPIAEQKRIVAKIDQLMELCNSLEQQIKDSTGKKSEILEAVLSRV